MMKYIVRSGTVFFLAFLMVVMSVPAGADQPLSIARLQYDGGGDWYNNPDVVPNLLEFIHGETGMPVSDGEIVVKATDDELFKYPILYVTGHGNISLSEMEARALRNYALAGGFIYVDDDYGLDESFRREVQKIFPDRPLQQLSPEHPLFNSYYQFSRLPRIHEHDPEQSPKAFGIRAEGEWVLLYTYNTNISDGWASPEVHGDPSEVRQTAFEMGLNIVTWVFSQ